MGLHIRILSKVKMRRIFGLVKDHVSIGRVRLRCNRKLVSLQVAVLQATNHDEYPASEHLVSLILQAGTGSRMRISQCISLLVARLNNTKSWIVALKCLTLIHKGLHRGGFVFQEQLSFHPTNGGKNYLNLSQFRDKSTPLAWEVSSWIRWYAKFLEALMEASRQLGRFFDSHSKLTPAAKISGLQNKELMRIILCLNALLQDICACQLKNTAATSHRLIRDALQIVVTDSITTQKELRVHLKEICERCRDLTTSQISELSHICEMLTTRTPTLVQLAELGFAMNLLHPLQCLEEILFTDHELSKIKDALRTSKSMNAALDATMPTKERSFRCFTLPS